MTTLLAFDTATELMSIALDAGSRVVVHESAGGALASARLVPAIMQLLTDNGVRLQDLDAIAFGRGPGAFTGLRTACSVAQGLALGAGKPVLAIDSLLAVAEDARAGDSAESRTWVTMDARMDEIYAAHYAWQSGRWDVLAPPRLCTPGLLNEEWDTATPQRIAGNALTVFGDRLRTQGAVLFPQALPRAQAMLPLARASWSQGGAVDAALALPLYLRDKVAQTTLEREAARAAKEAERAPG